MGQLSDPSFSLVLSVVNKFLDHKFQSENFDSFSITVQVTITLVIESTSSRKFLVVLVIGKDTTIGNKTHSLITKEIQPGLS